MELYPAVMTLGEDLDSPGSGEPSVPVVTIGTAREEKTARVRAAMRDWNGLDMENLLNQNQDEISPVFTPYIITAMGVNGSGFSGLNSPTVPRKREAPGGLSFSF